MCFTDKVVLGGIFPKKEYKLVYLKFRHNWNFEKYRAGMENVYLKRTSFIL